MPPKVESPTDVERWFRDQVAGLWPAALGSLSLRKSPCMRDHCAERESLEKSRAFKRGQRFRAGIEGRISVLFRGRAG